jgi:hypothetical protein
MSVRQVEIASFLGKSSEKQHGITKSANIPKFSHHPASYLPSLRLFPRLLTSASDSRSQREVFPVYITLPSSRQPTVLRFHLPKTLDRVPGIWNRRNKSNIKYSCLTFIYDTHQNLWKQFYILSVNSVTHSKYNITSNTFEILLILILPRDNLSAKICSFAEN